MASSQHLWSTHQEQTHKGDTTQEEERELSWWGRGWAVKGAPQSAQHRGGTGAEARTGWRRLTGSASRGWGRWQAARQEGEHRQRPCRGRLPGLILTASAKASGLASLPHPWTSHAMERRNENSCLMSPYCAPDTAGLVQNFHSPLQALIVGSTKFAVSVSPLCSAMTRGCPPGWSGD